MAERSARLAPERSVLLMSGADAASVLQDVVTNDVMPAVSEPYPAVYAALLTPQGKYLFDFFVLRSPDGGLLIDVAADRAEALSKRLSLYCLRRDARMEGRAALQVALLLPSPAAAGEGAGAGSGADEVTPVKEPPDGRVVADPRHATLGYRVYAPDVAAALASQEIALGGPEVAGLMLDRRIEAVVPESGIELVPEESYPLEAGLDRLAGVDFRKGCYVGQEVTARMRHRTELKKRLLRVVVEGDAPAGTAIETAEGKPAGTLFSQSRGRGLAHLRLDRSDGALRAGTATVRLEAADA